jgi:subtilisin family serine protease
MKFIRLFFLLLVLGLLLSTARQAFSQNSLERKIVVFKSDASREEKLTVVSRYQGVFSKDLRLINGAAVNIPQVMVERLARDPKVLRVDPDVEVYALGYPKVGTEGWCDWFPNWPGCTPTPTPTSTPTPTPTLTPSPSPSPTPTPTPGVDGTVQTLPWGIQRINADDAWGISSGSGVKVAVLDTGIDTDHPDLDNNLAGCLNFIYSWRNCEDDNGHGTHVSGIIAAENNNLGVVGVSPNAKIYALKVLDRRGRGYLSDIIEALDWAVQNGIQVVNMSLGTSSDVASFREAVQRVNAAGITQVAAAGNSGPGANTVLYPARYPEVIAISATDSSDQVPSWSSRGIEVDLAAPGKDIYSTYLRGNYKTLSGTSMSAPHVTGTVALRLFLRPGETPATIESVLEANTDPLPFDPTLVGAGLVNAYNVATAP